MYSNEPTKKSILLHKLQEQDIKKNSNLESSSITQKQNTPRTTYKQDFNNINEEVWQHSLLNPQ